MVDDFIFDGVSLSDFGYICLLSDESETIEVSNMGFSTIKGARTDDSQQTSYSYGDNYSTTFTIIKNPCAYNEENQFLTRDEISELTRWLARKEYKWFRFIDTEDNDEIWYKAQFNIDKEYAGDNVYGLTLTLNTNAPFGYSNILQTIYENFDSSEDKAVIVSSDDEGYIYPDVTITVLQAGNVKLVNDEEHRHTTILNCIQNEVITIKGAGVNQISSTNQNHNFAEDFNYNFPRLVKEYGNDRNIFSIPNTGTPINIKFEYRGIRKVGLE